MNSFIPYRYNQKASKFEPEVYVNFAEYVLLAPDSGQTVLSELKDLADRLNEMKEEFQKFMEEGVSNTLIIETDAPEGNAKKLWINSQSVIHYWDGEAWRPVAGTAV